MCNNYFVQSFRLVVLCFLVCCLANYICFLLTPVFFRYVKSRSDKQLLHGLGYNDTSSCMPEELSNCLPVVPCGLIAWSLFNDTYTFTRSRSKLKVNRKNIAWKSDREHKFGKHVYPFNFQNGTLIGGGSLDPNIPVSISIVLERGICHTKIEHATGRLEFTTLEFIDTYFLKICYAETIAPILVGHFLSLHLDKTDH